MQGSQRIDELRQKFHENPRRYFAPLANEYRKAGDPEQAIAICRAHLAQQPGHMSGHVVYGQALYDAHRIEEARVVFEKALSLDPDNAVVLKQLGDIARQNGETAEARHWYTRALDADPQDTQIAAYIAELTEPLTEVAASTPAAESAPPAEEVVREPETTPAAPAQEDVPWRKTPPHEETPFVTRTMAEVYARQGYHDAALDVYRQLALHHPDDKGILDRIEELSNEKTPQSAEAGAQSAPPTEPAAETAASAAETEPAAETVAEPERKPAEEPVQQEIAGSPVEVEPLSFAEDDAVTLYSSEDLNLETPPEAPAAPVHFTERELVLGDSWDTDQWAAGFSPDEGIDLAFETPDVPMESAEAAPAQDVVEQPSRGTPSAQQEVPAAESEPPAEMPEPSIPEAAAQAGTITEQEEEAEEEVAPDEPHLVAYSPQLPDDDELPHFAPKGPTMREFFATLGARRPPAREPRQAFTAHAAATMEPLPSHPADAFSGMFPDSPVTDEDTRAAFALSGALGVTAEPEMPSPPRRPPTPASSAPPVATSAAAQESEEDIRRFREWLDGLAES